jgi:Ser/Thr protein kinase RdoA (MazF antagonist)
MQEKTKAIDNATLVHGMDGSLVEPDWPPLTAGEVREVLCRFLDCDSAVEILTVSPRPFSAASLVRFGNRRVFVKRHARAVRNREGLREEHRFLEALRGKGAPVPTVLANRRGETVVETNEWTYEVHETPIGIDLYDEAISWTPFRSVSHARSAGRMLARLHRAAEGFSDQPRRTRPLVSSFSIFAAAEPATAMEAYLAERPALADDSATHRNCEEALEVLVPFHAELAPLLPALAPLWTHNDLHASNLFWSDARDDAEATAVIDFGLSDRTTAVHDLALAIERNIVEWLMLGNDPEHLFDVAVHFDHLRAMLAGYESVRPLSDAEAAVLAPMTALCHAEFALTEADYFLGVLHSPEKAQVATHDYLVGHARWFQSAAGRELLEALRRWAAERKAAHA